MALKRLSKELHDIADTKENDKAIALMPLKPEQFESNYKDDQNYYRFELRGIIIAPPGSPIAGYILFLDISIPPDYPFKPPKICFVNKVWHPKVQAGGNICSSFLYSQWDPNLTLETALLTIQSLLVDVGEDITHGNLLNRDAADQYLQNRSLYNSTALEYAKESNEGYGLASFYDYRILAVQAILNVTQKRRANTEHVDDEVYYYKMYVFCTRDSAITCTLCITIVPNLYMYRQYVEKQYQHYSKITTSCLHTVTNKFSISYDGDGFTRDKCWKISPISELTFTKDDIDRNLQEHPPITCELKLEWVRTIHDPERFLHQFSVIDAESLELIRSLDICIDSQPGGTKIATIRNKKYDECPTMPEIIKFQCTPGSKSFDITEAIGVKYSRFGIFLLEDETGSKMQDIKQQMKGEGCSNIAMEILRRWLEGEGKQPITWETLIEVLYDCQLATCADDIKSGISSTTAVEVPQS